MLLFWFMTALLRSERVLQTGSEHHIRVLLENNQLGSSPRQESGRGLNPSVVIIVVILTVVFLLSGFLHLLARCCGRVAARREPTESAMSALHGQLQHLFHLHDSGVDQAFIDTLPVFPYKAICGLKEGTDCAVCLSEFESEDRLRLLPKCKHAFHIDCIDTWLLSHSTCPLCRCALLSDDVSPSNGAFSDSGRLGSNRSMGSHGGFVGDSRRTVDISRRIASSSLLAEHGGGSGSELGKDDDNRMGLDSPEIQPVLDGTESSGSVASVLSVKLGRVERRASNHNNSGSILRGRSYSMGSYEYVVDPANLQVVIAPTPYPGRGKSREVAIGGRPRHRSVFSDSIPELGSNPGTPADELFWATRGLATPEYTTKPDGSGTSRLNLGHLAPEASLVPKSLGVVVDKCKGKDKEWVTIDLEAKEVSSAGIVINKTILPQDKMQESEESRILAGLERFFGSGWRSNVGLERLAESMLKRDKATVDGSYRSKAASEQGGESQKDHSMSRRTFSFRFPVPESLTRAGRSRRTMSENGGFDTASNKDTAVFDTASKDTGFETASKDGGFETASKESVGGLDTSSVGSFDSSWVGPPSQPLPQPIVNEESSQHAASLARKTIHWLMGRDRRVVGHANFSPSPEGGTQRRDDF